MNIPDSVWAEVILTVLWAIREIVGIISRRKQGYSGVLSLRPPAPNERITPDYGMKRKR